MADNKETNKKSFLQRIFKNRITTDDYAQIEDENSPPPVLNIRFSDSRQIIFYGLLIVALFFGAGGAWMYFAEITGAVIASGEVRVDTERKTVQHLEGGIVREIMVRNGDHVIAGQPLIILDSSRIVATTDQLSLQIAAATLEDLRLKAEKSLLSEVSWPAKDLTIPQRKFDELLDAGRKVFQSGRRALKNQMALLNSQIEQLYQQHHSLDGRLKSEQQIIATLQD
ncbi:MAG: biotin/lipoyl-binding protein, partial [Deltaproteobacteria bacterium]|nr:biotin/lipoyl-binding protein [Deltaproteobacteria bacterium]